MAFHWRVDDGLTLTSGLGSGPVLLRNPIFYDLQGGGGVRTPVPPLDPRMLSTMLSTCHRSDFINSGLNGSLHCV